MVFLSSSRAVGTTGGRTMTPVEIRKSARQLASQTVQEQMASFRTYGIMSDWEKRWTTMDKDYEIKQLRLFQRMVRRGLIYRKLQARYTGPHLPDRARGSRSWSTTRNMSPHPLLSNS